MSKQDVFIGRNIRKRRKKLGLTQRDLAEEVKLGHHQTISAIERGERELRASELANIARVLKTSTNNLLEPEQVSEEAPVLWRDKPEDRGTKEAQFRKRCEQYHLLEKVLDQKQMNRLTSQVEEPLDNLQGLAEKVRNTMNLGSKPASSLRQTLEEDYFVKIWFLDMGESGSGACTKDHFGCGILINRSEAPWRMNFSLAHELFHLLTWEETVAGMSESEGTLSKGVESKANTFAANLLLPAQDVFDHFSEKIEQNEVFYSDLIKFSRSFKVSTETLIWRLHNLNLINRETVNRILDDDGFREMDKSTMNEYWETPPEKPERFVRLTGLAFMRDKISKAKAADLLDTSLFDLEDTFKRYGISTTNDRNATNPG